MKKTVETSIVFSQQNECTYKKNVEVDVYGWDDDAVSSHEFHEIEHFEWERWICAILSIILVAYCIAND